MKSIAATIAAGLLFSTGSYAQATIQVGEQAKLTYQTVDGKSVNIEKLHGKIVVVDFWATWCGPCMAEAPHMVAMNEKYASKGLILLGVSLDSDKAAMIAVAKQKNFTWPQYFDGQGWNNAIWKQWGASGIPFTVLIDPNGKVVYTGHPAGGLDAKIEETFKNTPPFMVDPKILADASKVLDQVEEKLTAKDPKSALKLLSKVPAAAKADEAFAARAKDVQKKLEDAAESMLGEVDPLVSAGNYSEAMARLRELADGLTGTPYAAKAKKQLADLMAKPEAKAALAKADQDAREAKAADALAAATKLQQAQKDEEAYKQFRAITTAYSGTAAAATAAEQMKAFEQKNPALAQKANDSAIAGKAKAALSVAASYERLGKYDEAKEKYQSVIDAYPGTSYAATAKEHLAQLTPQ